MFSCRHDSQNRTIEIDDEGVKKSIALFSFYFDKNGGMKEEIKKTTNVYAAVVCFRSHKITATTQTSFEEIQIKLNHVNNFC